MAKTGELARRWYVADASGVPLGRLASRVASVLRGKHRPQFTPHVDCGDGVIVVNAEKVVLTGRKREQKTKFRHSGYPGGVKLTSYQDLMKTRPERAVEWAVEGMLPDSRLASRQIRHLRVYRGPAHPHAAQSPQPLPHVR